MNTPHAAAVLLLLGVLSASFPARAGEDSPKSSPAARPASSLSNPSPVGVEESTATYTSLDAPTDDQTSLPPGLLKFTDADVGAVLEIYQELSNRTVVRPGNLPNAKITLRSQTRLTRREALQSLDTVLAAQGITMIPMGLRHVKAVPMAQAAMEAAPLVELPYDQLPESGTYITYIIKLKHLEPAEAAAVMQPFAKMPGNSILAVPGSGMLIVRDYSVNVRRMIQVLNKLEAAQKDSGEKQP